ncbi:MAG: phosphoribosylanthranilate isomerase [Oscillospiraceae bacterium]|nr:phosphoribosylanthranilate isomerase [Oscillospiraceae bacterium]
MTGIKLCGLSRSCDIAAANALKPEYIGFVFAQKSRRCVTPEQAAALKQQLSADIQAVGVFVDEPVENVAELLQTNVIDLAQLHGGEDEAYIAALRQRTDRPIIQAFRIATAEDLNKAVQSSADLILLDSGAGTGTVFDWQLISHVHRPYFLAGGLNPDNVADAIEQLHPYAVDVSSGIETDRVKDQGKMAAFVAAVRKDETL